MATEKQLAALKKARAARKAKGTKKYKKRLSGVNEVKTLIKRVNVIKDRLDEIAKERSKLCK